MPKKYTEEQIKDECTIALNNGANLFYKNSFVNYTGTVKDKDNLYCSEVVADFVLEHIDEFKNIKKITRKNSYKTEHDGTNDNDTNRLEEIYAKEIFSQSQNGDAFSYIGKMVDYQTPLKNVRSDRAGKIDLLAEAEDAVYILELKKEDSTETMLRCVLEGYTYLKTVDCEKLLEDFNIAHKPVYAAPFVFKGGRQWKELQDGERDKHPKLIELMEKLEIKGPFYIERNTRYEVVNK